MSSPYFQLSVEQAQALAWFKMTPKPQGLSRRRANVRVDLSGREETEMRVAAMELALIHAGNAEAVKAALSVCPAIAAGKAGQKILFRAALFDQQDILQILLDAGADPNGQFAQHADGSSPLHAAAYPGNTACLEKLLRAGADVNAACGLGMTPLHAAAVPGHVDCARSLLRAGADASRRDSYGHTPICIAAKRAVSPREMLLLRYLLAALGDHGKNLWDVYGDDAPQCTQCLETVLAKLRLPGWERVVR